MWEGKEKKGDGFWGEWEVEKKNSLVKDVSDALSFTFLHGYHVEMTWSKVSSKLSLRYLKTQRNRGSGSTSY